MKAARDTAQALQRIKVGLTGLAAVILLIAIASAIMRTATREAPAGAGSAKTELVDNMVTGNSIDDPTGEPLAELGVAPSSSNAAQAAGRGR